MIEKMADPDEQMMTAPDERKTGIVIPCFNEALRLSVDSLRSLLKQFPDINLCLVNDGSTDDTGSLLYGILQLHEDQVRVLHLKQNRGKAEAVRQGMLCLCAEGGYRFLGYWDADGATPFEEIFRFVEIFKTDPEIKVVLGARVRRMGADIQRYWYRHYLGRIFATFASLVLEMPVYDTQCGAKLFSADLACSIFQEPLLTNWVFDVELLARVSRALFPGCHRAIFELPLRRWEDKHTSRLRFSDYLQAPFELYKIYVNYRWIDT